MAAARTTRKPQPPPRIAAPVSLPRMAMVLLLFWAAAATLQAINGAWRADFGAHPDEAAHVVTGLMVRDYMAGGFLSQLHPMRYAESYYDHFPKVALGHYPPGFYLTEALFLLPHPSTGAVLLHLSFIAAALALLTFFIGLKLTGNRPLAFAAALVLLLLPVVQRYTSVIMADLLVALLMLASAVAFARFLVTASARHSLLFGLLASATILTKGSGLLLALLPPLAIALSGRWSLLAKPALWLAPVPVLLLALPWMWFTHDISSEGMRGVPLLQHIREALVFYPAYLPRMIGWGGTILCVIGILTVLRLTWLRKPIATTALPVALLSLVIALYAFHVLCPIGLEDRYLLPVLAPLLLFAILLLQTLTRIAELPARAAWVPAALLLLLTWIEVIRTQPKTDRSFTTLATLVATNIPQSTGTENHQTEVLVSSDARGEGAFIAAMALAVNNRSNSPVRVLRSSQRIASSDWMGRGYQLAATTPEGVEELLEELRVDFVIVDPGLGDPTRRPHHDLMVRWWRENHDQEGTPATRDPGAPVLVDRQRSAPGR